MATRMTNRTERLIKMEQLLFRSASGLRAVELAEACGVDRRTVYRDLSLLGEVGVPIEQRDGRFWLQREQYLATIRLSFDETVALLLAASAARHANPHLNTAVAKLGHSLPDSVAAHAHLLAETAQQTAADAGRAKMLDLLTHAWGEQRCVRLWYPARERGSRPREVSIYFIELKSNGVVYVVGYDSLRERVRAFRLSRIERVELLPGKYQMPFPFDTRRYLLYLRGSSTAQTVYPQEPSTGEARLRTSG